MDDGATGFGPNGIEFIGFDGSMTQKKGVWILAYGRTISTIVARLNLLGQATFQAESWQQTRRSGEEQGGRTLVAAQQAGDDAAIAGADWHVSRSESRQERSQFRAVHAFTVDAARQR
jgi:hypothetical protein